MCQVVPPHVARIQTPRNTWVDVGVGVAAHVKIRVTKHKKELELEQG